MLIVRSIKPQTPMSSLAAPLPLDTRETLIEAALACFAKYGYEATSIRQIAAEAGKNSSLISYYFKSKEGLYREVFREVLNRLGTESAAPASAAPEATKGEDARTRLRELIRRFLREVEAHLASVDPLQDAAVRLFLSEMNAPKNEVRDLIQERMEPWARGLRACIRGIRPDLSPADVDFWGITIHGCCVGHALRTSTNQLVWTSADPHLPQDELANRLADFAYNGLFCW